MTSDALWAIWSYKDPHWAPTQQPFAFAFESRIRDVVTRRPLDFERGTFNLVAVHRTTYEKRTLGHKHNNPHIFPPNLDHSRMFSTFLGGIRADTPS